MKQTILLFGGLSILILLLFQLSKYSLLQQQLGMDTYIALFGLLFIFLGFMLSRLFKKKSNLEIPQNEQASTPTSTNISDSTTTNINQEQLLKTGLSEREYEILLLIAAGSSNSEIAEKLFISENTVKTHVSKILTKLNAKRRTQAVQIARELNIL